MDVLHQALAPVLLQIEWLKVLQLIVGFVAVQHRWTLFVDLEREQSMKSNRQFGPGTANLNGFHHQNALEYFRKIPKGNLLDSRLAISKLDLDA